MGVQADRFLSHTSGPSLLNVTKYLAVHYTDIEASRRVVDADCTGHQAAESHCLATVLPPVCLALPVIIIPLLGSLANLEIQRYRLWDLKSG